MHVLVHSRLRIFFLIAQLIVVMRVSPPRQVIQSREIGKDLDPLQRNCT